MWTTLFRSVLKLPEFRGKWRLIRFFQRRLSPFQCHVKHGLVMELDVFEWAQLHLAQFGETEPATTRVMFQILQPGDTYVDVGAHVGFLSLVGRLAVGETGHVIAIEPQPYNCARLLRNWELNGFSNLRLYVAAAGAEGGMVNLPNQAVTDKSRLSIVLEMPDALSTSFEVPMITIEDVVKREAISRIKLLKMDVEGYEAQVLKGLGDAVDIVDNVIFEALEPGKELGDRNHQIRDWFAQRMFTVLTMDNQVWDGSYPIPENNLLASKNATILYSSCR